MSAKRKTKKAASKKTSKAKPCPKRPLSRNSKSTKAKGTKKMENIVKAYKAFDADMSCRGFKFEVGATYQHQGTVQLCQSGFHACAVPFDCWGYYPGSLTLARVKMADPIAENSDSKLVTGRITIEASLNLPAWIKEQVATIWDICKASSKNMTSAAQQHAASTGNYAHAASTGNYAHAASTGYRAHAASTGNYAHAASTGYRAHARALGKDAVAAAIGIGSRAAAGENGLLVVGYRDAQDRHRVAIGYVGEKGIEPQTWYEADRAGNLVNMGKVS